MLDINQPGEILGSKTILCQVCDLLCWKATFDGLRHLREPTFDGLRHPREPTFDGLRHPREPTFDGVRHPREPTFDGLRHPRIIHSSNPVTS